MPRRIAICVDDYGLHAGIDAAVHELHEHGRISAVSCMVGAPSWKRGAPALRETTSATMDVGLHLDLIEFPLDPAMRHSLRAWIARTYARAIDAAALRAEIHAQLDAFERGVHRPPAHVDGHQHVHQFPVVRETLLAVLAERYPQVGHRPWLRRTRRSPGAGLKAAIIESLGSEALTHLAGREGFALNRHLLGVYDFQASAPRYRELLLEWFAHAQDGDLIMCHASREAVPRDGISQARLREFEVFADSRFDAWVERANVSIVPISQVVGALAAAGV